MSSETDMDGGSRKSRHSRRRGSMHKRVINRRGHRGGGGVADGAAPVGTDGTGGYGIEPMSMHMKGGHRCSMHHKRYNRTRKSHVGGKSRKHRSHRKKRGMTLKSILGRY